MTEILINQVPIQSEGDIVLARRMVRETATSLGFGITDRTRIITAASELARNIVTYAGSGLMHVRSLSRGGAVGLEIAFEDHGPGIPDLALAMREGFSTSGGFGMGLPGARRLMDEMDVDSVLDQGTLVRIRKWRGAR
jgi:serine/threonine-protein kinase RsbT